MILSELLWLMLREIHLPLVEMIPSNGKPEILTLRWPLILMVALISLCTTPKPAPRHESAWIAVVPRLLVVIVVHQVSAVLAVISPSNQQPLTWWLTTPTVALTPLCTTPEPAPLHGLVYILRGQRAIITVTHQVLVAMVVILPSPQIPITWLEIPCRILLSITATSIGLTVERFNGQIWTVPISCHWCHRLMG